LGTETIDRSPAAPAQPAPDSRRLASVQELLEPENLRRALPISSATGPLGSLALPTTVRLGSSVVTPTLAIPNAARGLPFGAQPAGAGPGGLLGNWPPPGGNHSDAERSNLPSPPQPLTVLVLAALGALGVTLPLPGSNGPPGNRPSRSSVIPPASGAASSLGARSSRSDGREAALPALLALNLATWRTLLRQARRIPAGLTQRAPLPPG
jgi:hypothetical protein